MQFRIDSSRGLHFIKLEPGEDILPELKKYCQKHNIKSGYIQGIGAVKEVTLGYFDIEKKQYLRNNIRINAEMLSCLGNISKNEKTGEYIIHCHIILGDNDFRVIGGHLFENTIISVTGEFIITESKEEIYRSLDDKFNLSLLKL